MIVNIIHDLFHPIHGCSRHILRLFRDRKFQKSAQYSIIYFINRFHIRIDKCIKQLLLCRILLVKYPGCKTGILYIFLSNTPKKAPAFLPGPFCTNSVCIKFRFDLHLSAIYRESTACAVVFNLLEVLQCLHILCSDFKIHFCICLHMVWVCSLWKRNGSKL